MEENDTVREWLELASDCALVHTAMRAVMQMTDADFFSIAYEARNRIVDEHRFLVRRREQLLGDSEHGLREEATPWSCSDEREEILGDRVREVHEQVLAAFESIGEQGALFDLHPAWHNKPAEDCMPDLARSPDYASISLSVSQQAAVLRSELCSIQSLPVPECAGEIAQAGIRLDLGIRVLQDQFKMAIGWPVSRDAKAIAIRNARASRYFQSSALSLDEALVLMDRLLQCFCASSDESTDWNALALIVRSFIEPTVYGAEIDAEG